MSDLLHGVAKTVIVTGGCGFIGSAVIRKLLRDTDFRVVNVDKLTYASSEKTLRDVEGSPRYHFVRADIASADAVRGIFQRFSPDAIMNLAAETHVDRSIDGPSAFVHSNFLGVFNLLEVAREHTAQRPNFRFHQISTDEVFGSLGPKDLPFSESTRYDPSSPYSATKASADHLVQAWGKTFGLDVVLTNCSNNYGPFQFPEKLIPLMILNALAGKTLPVYGDGRQVREWLYVDDHADALLKVLIDGRAGESYNIGSGEERFNIDVVKSICATLDACMPSRRDGGYSSLIEFVIDRPAHDRRYAIDSSKLHRELDWRARETFDTGLAKTVDWYLSHRSWWAPLQARYAQTRLGIV